jgi:DNA-binding NtrC family response regulator
MTESAKAGHSVALVVEDDFLVRSSTIDMLTDLGWSTLEADRPEAAIDLVHRSDDITLVIADLHLGGGDGRAFLESARSLRPGLAVIIASGTRMLAEAPPDWVILPKPFSIADLDRAVRRALTPGRT